MSQNFIDMIEAYSNRKFWDMKPFEVAEITKSIKFDIDYFNQLFNNVKGDK